MPLRSRHGHGYGLHVCGSVRGSTTISNLWGIFTRMPKNIKVAIAGVGNCASALVQGVEYYRSRRNAALDGVMRQTIGGYRASDVEFVSAFDVDRARSAGRWRRRFSPSRTTRGSSRARCPCRTSSSRWGPSSTAWRRTWRTTTTTSLFARPTLSRLTSPRLCASRALEVLLCYLPVGSDKAVKHYAQACLEAGVAWSIASPCSSLLTPNGRRSSATPACRSSATTSRARSARPSFIARSRGCSPTVA